MLACAPSTADALEGQVSPDGQARASGQLYAVPPPPPGHFQDWSRQSTTVPDEDDDVVQLSSALEAKLLGAPVARLLPRASHESTASGSLRDGSGASTPTLAAAEAAAEGGADAEDDEREAKDPEEGWEAVHRTGPAARRLAFGASSDVGGLGDLGDFGETDDEGAVLRVRLAARRLALGRAIDGDSDSDPEVEEAALRMGRCARLWATSSPGTPGPPQPRVRQGQVGTRAGDDADAESEGENDDVKGFLKAVRQWSEQEAKL